MEPPGRMKKSLSVKRVEPPPSRESYTATRALVSFPCSESHHTQTIRHHPFLRKKRYNNLIPVDLRVLLFLLLFLLGFFLYHLISSFLGGDGHSPPPISSLIAVFTASFQFLAFDINCCVLLAKEWARGITDAALD